MTASLLLAGQPLSAVRRAMGQDGADPVVQRLLPLWFAVPDEAPHEPENLARPRRWWFDPSDALDGALISLFAHDVGLALRGDYDHLVETGEGALGLILLTHHLPRRMWRGSPRAMAGRATARSVCLEAIRSGKDQTLSPLKRAVAYGPLLESDDRIDVERACTLFERLDDPYWIGRAYKRLEQMPCPG